LSPRSIPRIDPGMTSSAFNPDSYSSPFSNVVTQMSQRVSMKFCVSENHIGGYLADGIYNCRNRSSGRSRRHQANSPMSARSSTTTAGPPDSGLTQRKPTPGKEDFFGRGNNGKLMPLVAAAHEERYSILDRRMAKERKTLGLGFLKTLVLITLILWIALPIFCEFCLPQNWRLD
jgi:hypothetical protein